MPLTDVRSATSSMTLRNIDLFVSTIKAMSVSTPETSKKLISTLERIGNIHLYQNRHEIRSLIDMACLLNNYANCIFDVSDNCIYAIRSLCNLTNNILESDRNGIIYVQPVRVFTWFEVKLKLMNRIEFDEYYNRE